MNQKEKLIEATMRLIEEDNDNNNDDMDTFLRENIKNYDQCDEEFLNTLKEVINSHKQPDGIIDLLFKLINKWNIRTLNNGTKINDTRTNVEFFSSCPMDIFISYFYYSPENNERLKMTFDFCDKHSSYFQYPETIVSMVRCPISNEDLNFCLNLSDKYEEAGSPDDLAWALKRRRFGDKTKDIMVKLLEKGYEDYVIDDVFDRDSIYSKADVQFMLDADTSKIGLNELAYILAQDECPDKKVLQLIFDKPKFKKICEHIDVLFYDNRKYGLKGDINVRYEFTNGIILYLDKMSCDDPDVIYTLYTQAIKSYTNGSKVSDIKKMLFKFENVELDKSNTEESEKKLRLLMRLDRDMQFLIGIGKYVGKDPKSLKIIGYNDEYWDINKSDVNLDESWEKFDSYGNDIKSFMKAVEEIYGYTKMMVSEKIALLVDQPFTLDQLKILHQAFMRDELSLSKVKTFARSNLSASDMDMRRQKVKRQKFAKYND